MISSTDLLRDFTTMFQERWAYAAGAAQRGRVDCSGAFVWAYRQHGCSLYHGSNRMARDEVTALLPLGRATVVPGMAAFKARGPALLNLNGYALPEAYKPGGAHHNGDLNDYYHVGLVDAQGRVLNAQSARTGFVASDLRQGGWTHVAYLKQVRYDDAPAESAPQLRVTAPSGGTVNLRQGPSLQAALVARVPLGATVEPLAPAQDGWQRIRWGQRVGYMMTAFLQEVS